MYSHNRAFWLLVGRAAAAGHVTRARGILTLKLSLTEKRPFSTEQRGAKYQESFRLFFKSDSDHYVSPLHDIPVRPPGCEPNVFSMVVEIPRWTNAKMEIRLNDPLNPIRQDFLDGAVRFVPHVFPFKGYIWNYGAIPQTWEDPSLISQETQSKGDGDPIDIIEVGAKVHPSGSVLNVKVLGILPLVDEGETDWKVIAIDTEDDEACEINDLESLERKKPGLLGATITWFQNYKTLDGKPQNKFAFGGQIQESAFAVRVIEETHNSWRNLMKMNDPPQEISMISTQHNSRHKISSSEAAQLVHKLPPKTETNEFDSGSSWYYL